MAARTERVCECCKRTFTARTADVARGWARFCSKRCKAIKQEQRTGFHADYLDRKQARDFSHAMSEAEQGWDAHKDY